MRATGYGDGDGDIGGLVVARALFAPSGVGGRYFRQRLTAHLYHHVVDGNLVFVGAAVELPADFEETIDLAINREVEMRNCLLRFR